MPTVIDKLPIYQNSTTVAAPNGDSITIHPFQIVLFVSLAHGGEKTLHPHTPHFPAVLDTGFNRQFLLQQEHLTKWAGIHPDHFTEVEKMTAYGKKFPVRAANVWIHQNVPGTRDLAPDQPAFCIPIDPGIGVCPEEVKHPRLPLLGLRALFLADLHLSITWQRKPDPVGLVTLRTGRKLFGLFG